MPIQKLKRFMEIKKILPSYLLIFFFIKTFLSLNQKYLKLKLNILKIIA